MTLQSVVDSLDAVPEPLRDQYKADATSGKFVLDVNVAEHPGAAGLRRVNEQIKAEKTALAEKFKPFEGLDPADVQAALEARKKADDEKARLAGDQDAWKKQIQDGHAKELGKKDSEIQRRDAALHRRVARDEARAAIVSEDGNADLLMPHVLESVKVVEKDGDWRAEVVDARGNPRYDATTGESMTIAQLVKEMRGKDAFKSAFAAPPASGTGARGGALGRSSSGDIVLTKEQAQDVQFYRRQRTEAEKLGVRVVVQG